MNARSIYLLRTAVTAISSGLIFIGLSAYYIRQVGMSPLQLVLVGTAIELTCFLFEVPTGVVADTYSRKWSVIIGGVLVGVCYVITGLAPVFIAIIVAEIIRGIGETFISGAGDAWITDEVGADNVGALFLRAGQLWPVFGLIGSFASVLLASKFGYAVPILIGATMTIALAAFSAFAMPETGFVRPPVEARPGASLREHGRSMMTTFRDGAKLVRGTPVLVLLLLVELVRGASSEGFDRLSEAHLLTSFNLPVLSLPGFGQLDSIAWFFVLEVIGAILSFTVLEVARRRIDMNNHAALAKAMMVAYGVVVIVTLGFALTGNFAVALGALVVRGLCWSLAGPIAGVWMNQSITDSRVRATVLSMNGQANALGQIAGGPGVGAVGNLFGIRAAIALASMLLAPTLALFGRTIQRRLPTTDDMATDATIAVAK
jgi:DHA3 family tetracycline resistance protein-like MFS transporter